jgi:pimeloyl-ACP methyl ester carboxylesterase
MKSRYWSGLTFGLLVGVVLVFVADKVQARPYYEHSVAGQQRATVMFFHGGGWSGDLDAEADEVMAPFIDAVGGRYRTVNVAYRSGGASSVDAEHAYRREVRLRPHQPICLMGVSAGAQLALIVAARHPEVACVVDLVGPPVLNNPDAAPASDRVTEWATQAFGPDALERLSPMNRVADLRQVQILVVASECDIFIDLATQQRFAGRLGENATIAEVGHYHCLDQDAYDETPVLDLEADYLSEHLEEDRLVGGSL